MCLLNLQPKVFGVSKLVLALLACCQLSILANSISVFDCSVDSVKELHNVRELSCMTGSTRVVYFDLVAVLSFGLKRSFEAVAFFTCPHKLDNGRAGSSPRYRGSLELLELKTAAKPLSLATLLTLRYRKVAYLDTDVGQPEFPAPGFLSLTVVDKLTPGLAKQRLSEAFVHCYHSSSIICWLHMLLRRCLVLGTWEL
ncbi:hypothetical protein Q3G72_024977 [Acer saccharum]|nr:hypothetical protein Q3G72_024977 [Acer saccharum]